MLVCQNVCRIESTLRGTFRMSKISGCVSAAPSLLLHNNLLLAVYSGGLLATSARLKWDPSTYIAVRELFPLEYHVSAALLPATAVILLLLAHLSIIARTCSSKYHRTANFIYCMYAGAMSVMVCTEVSWCLWLVGRISAWLDSEQADELREALEMRHHLNPILKSLGRWHPLPIKVKALMEEAEADVPYNGYAAAVALVSLVVLQITATLLALMATTRPVHHTRQSTIDGLEEQTPLKTVYKNGRLVMV